MRSRSWPAWSKARNVQLGAGADSAKKRSDVASRPAVHPQVIGRGHRLMMLERLIEAIEERDGVVFGRLDEYQERWRAANPLAEWLAAQPVHARVTAPDGMSAPR